VPRLVASASSARQGAPGACMKTISYRILDCNRLLRNCDRRAKLRVSPLPGRTWPRRQCDRTKRIFPVLGVGWRGKRA
jgi:hypothetical protein